MSGGDLAAIVLAAGDGRRMGGRPKASLVLGGRTFVELIVASARAAGISRIVVVRGPTEIPTPEGVEVVLNATPERGMLVSIQRGLEALGHASPSPAARSRPAAIPEEILGAFIWPVDCPRVPPAVLLALACAVRAGAPIAVPRVSGRRGHPVLFAARCFPELFAAPLDIGARAVVRAHGTETAEVDVAAPEVLDDIDTPDDYERIRRA